MSLVHDSENLHASLEHIIEDPNLPNAQAVLRFGHLTEPLDPTLAYSGRLVGKVSIDRIAYSGPIVSGEGEEIIPGLWREYDRVFHSGHTIACFWTDSN